MGFVHRSAHTMWLTVDSRSRSMDRWLVFGGPSPPTFPFGLAYVHRVQARAAGGEALCFHPRRAPTGGVLTGVILRRRWRPIKVGKDSPGPGKHDGGV